MYRGILISIIPNTATHSTDIATANTPPAVMFIKNAIIIAPNTINGERINSLNTRFTPDCIWFTSLVILVIIFEVPSPSISLYERVCIFENKSCLSSFEKPTAARAAKYCAATALIKPTTPSPTKIRHANVIYRQPSPPLIPLSIIAETTSGTKSSNAASSNLNNGASTLCNL